jgi:predicted PurR-regulated permease PerM
VVLLLFVFVILIPLAGLLAVVVDQAINASKTIGPILKERLSEPGNLLDQLNDIPIVHTVFPDHAKFLEAIEGVIKGIGNFVIDNLGHISTGAVKFFFDFFVMLFTMYYFLIYGKQYLEWLLYCLPLNSEEENLLLSKFTTVTRATLKGTFVIGAIQGALGGIGMAIAGIPNTLFWGVIMAVFSIIPAVGPAIIWAPAAVYLITTGHTLAGAGLALFGLIIVGNIDNLIRPKLVGKEAQLPDLMIFFGTLGGLALFGAAGIIIGPIVAALFVSLWDIYAKTFREQLDPSHLVIKGETVIDEVIPGEIIDSSEEEKDLKQSKKKKKGKG